MVINAPPIIKQGHIYLVNLNPSKGTEAGKIRPALVIQTDLLNKTQHPSTLVVPLTTQLASEGNLLRLRLKPRDQLQQLSEAMLDQIRAIDNRRFCSDALSKLNPNEWQHLKQAICQLI